MGDAKDDPDDVEITPKRIGELILWHGTDETALPPAHTLQHLSRDTIAALRQLARARETITRLRAAMGRAFWATDRRELHTILLDALGPPPDEPPPEEPALRESPQRRAQAAQSEERERPPPPRESDASATAALPTRLDTRSRRGPHRPGAVRSIGSRRS